jgi:uncharacterized protein (DUF1015 family)
MADLRPFRALRYRVGPGDTVGRVLAPPYDVISPQQQAALYDLSPYNVVRLEHPRETGEARYRAAAETLAQWRREGVLMPDERPALYVYEQEFAHGGQTYRRRAVFGRVRLEPFETGLIRPHEYTMAKPKEDRLALLRATRANISPIFGLVDDRGGGFARALADVPGRPALDAVDFAEQRHRLSVVDDPAAIARLAAAVADTVIYIADGHHRYETALAYREERRQATGPAWSADDPANFVLMALTATTDPGLLILPIHRLVRPRTRPADLVAALGDAFAVEEMGALDSGAACAALIRAMEARRADTAFGAAGLAPGRLHLLTLRDRATVEAHMPVGHAPAWRALDVNVLQYGVLEPLLGINAATLTAGEHVEFTEDAGEALAAVRSGRVPLAFLVNATRVEQIVAVADAGDRMPQKSTYFYPKLGTGLVINCLDC